MYTMFSRIHNTLMRPSKPVNDKRCPGKVEPDLPKGEEKPSPLLGNALLGDRQHSTQFKK